ncbi:MAG: FAD/NAD(P)-binding protein [Candidatus Cloacimonetes bacterium]|nr:FAD/NAD(P)-binding protein [Candidatus Cloacimonadota bacterium]
MCNCENTYIPIPMKVEKILIENPDRSLRTYDLSFVNEEDRKKFTYMPGQFCEFSILGKGESPFGIASSPTEEGIIKFTVSRTGSVTNEIHYLQEGDIVGIRGPMGNWYPLEKLKGQDVVIVGGGFAFTTLRSMIVFMLENRDDYGKITVIYGARHPDLFIFKEELKEWDKRDDIILHLTVDKPVKGWNKLCGFVPAITKDVKPDPTSWCIVCGPPIMIKFTLPVLLEIGFAHEKIYTSLERRMKCGIGKCGRCGIGSKYICIDGPVFSYEELKKIPDAF